MKLALFDHIRETLAIDRVFRDFAHDILICEQCGTRVRVRDVQPLSFVNCPNCNNLLFVRQEVNGWLLMKPLGAGGMGSAFMARATADHSRKAAVKVLTGERATPSAMDKLMKEAETAAAFGTHPSLAQIYDYGRTDDMAFLIMELVEGMSLRDKIVVNGVIDPEEALYYGMDLIEGLEHIHKFGYIYRDLNPENVMIRNTDRAGLIDFGLCLTHEEAWTREGEVIGTPLYVPPERCFKLGEDLRSDIYSLGMVLFHGLTGSTFFAPTRLVAVIRGHTGRLRLRTKAKIPAYDEGLFNMIDMMIRKNRDERVDSYEELRELFYGILVKLQATDARNAVVQKRREEFRQTYGVLQVVEE